MVRVYSTTLPATAHILRGALETFGVAAVVRGEARTALAGALPLEQCYAEVWVSPSDEDAARAVVERVFPLGAAGALSLPGEAEERTCPACYEPSPATFERCWSCSTELG